MSVGMKLPTLNKENLAFVYTPGVGEVCMEIKNNPALVNTLTNRMNMVAVISTGKGLKTKALSALPYLDWLCLQLKYFGNLDAFPLVVSPEANLDEVVKDISGSMAGILSLDEEEPKEVGDVVFASMLNVAKALNEHFTEGETVAYILKQKLENKDFGVVTAKVATDSKEGAIKHCNKDFKRQFANISEMPTRVFTNYSNRENSIFLHDHFRGKIYSKLNFSNFKVLKEFINKETLERMAQAIEKDPAAAYACTSKSNLCSIVTDGTAILGLGNIGPRAGLPVMEGKSCLFKMLGGVDVVPLCIQPRKTHEEEIRAIHHLIGGFAGVNLEDIKAPQCFEIEEALSATAPIPIFHDDQHGTAIVVLAGMINAVRLAGKKPEDCKLVINGAGAAGLTITKLMLFHGFKNILVCDTKGIIDQKRSYSDNKYKDKISKATNPDNVSGQLQDAIKGADCFVGVSAPNALKPEWVPTMAPKAIIFALANPHPEILPPDALKQGAFICATGRSDFPNQINNSLVFPGIFKGLLTSGMTKVSDEVKRITSVAIAASVKDEELSTTYIIPPSLSPDIPNIISAEINKFKAGK